MSTRCRRRTTRRPESRWPSGTASSRRRRFAHPPEAGTCRWYVWAGQIDDPSREGDDFFVPLHVTHLADWCPQLVPYLALPPGWSVILAPGYEDVWFDPALLEP